MRAKTGKIWGSCLLVVFVSTLSANCLAEVKPIKHASQQKPWFMTVDMCEQYLQDLRAKYPKHAEELLNHPYTKQNCERLRKTQAFLRMKYRRGEYPISQKDMQEFYAQHYPEALSR